MFKVILIILQLLSATLIAIQTTPENNALTAHYHGLFLAMTIMLISVFMTFALLIKDDVS